MKSNIKIIGFKPTRAQMQLHNMVVRNKCEVLDTIMFLASTIDACPDELKAYAKSFLGFVEPQEEYVL